MDGKEGKTLDRDAIASYLVRVVDRPDLDETDFNNLLQDLGIEPRAESARIGSRLTGISLPPENKGAGIE
ncbi:MAG TPA: hypothetical protein DD435_12200 [Cyanobacteria bacterium UBA8530]|nr:hypothetical protein [Cyanobacteria bacterium UBA8530]